MRTHGAVQVAGDSAVLCARDCNSPTMRHAPEGAQEILAVHACLALLVGGAAMYQAIGWETEKLGPALKKIAEENVIKDQNGKKLLQVCLL